MRSHSAADQYVSWVGDVDDFTSMITFFSGFMLENKTVTFTNPDNLGAMNGTGAL